MAEKTMGALTPNCKIALAYMQEHINEMPDVGWVGSDLGNLAGVAGIHPVMNSLVKRGLVEKGTTSRDFTNKAGVTAPKEYVTYMLTDAGKDFIINETDAD
jgi:hypothetical protein